MLSKCSKPEDTTYVNVIAYLGDGGKYRIDPIHFNSDICCNIDYFDVNLALEECIREICPYKGLFCFG